MAMWREKIGLNKAIAKANDQFDLTRLEEPCPQEVKDMICAEIKKSNVLNCHVFRIQSCKTIAELNRKLERVFDDADKFLIWCGL